MWEYLKRNKGVAVATVISVVALAVLVCLLIANWKWLNDGESPAATFHLKER